MSLSRIAAFALSTSAVFLMMACVSDYEVALEPGPSAAPEAGDAGTGDPSDARTGADGADGVDGADAAVDSTAGPTFLTNADFERGCVGWATKSAISGDDLHPRSGEGACRVCSTTGGSAGPFQISQRATKLEAAGARIVVEAFVRAPQGAGASLGTFAKVELRNAAGAVLAAHEGNTITPGQSWGRTGVIADVPDAATTLDVIIVSVGSQDRCFVVDDVTVAPAP